MLCNICSSSVSVMATARILKRYDIQYYACDNCKFIQTEVPYWLSEAYSEVIGKSDIGLVGRNIALSKITTLVIALFFDPDSRFLDYGGGNGMFVRLMRDKGLNFYWRDKYAENAFATGFEYTPGDHYELVTAFEVFEHLPNPLDEISEMLKLSDNILFSTLLLPKTPPLPQEWWYYSLDGGQHVSFYALESLHKIADKFKVSVYTNGLSLHLFTRKKISKKVFTILTRCKYSTLLLPLVARRKSLLAGDYFQITGSKLM